MWASGARGDKCLLNLVGDFPDPPPNAFRPANARVRPTDNLSPFRRTAGNYFQTDAAPRPETLR
jgi:hypothetical protein